MAHTIQYWRVQITNPKFSIGYFNHDSHIRAYYLLGKQKSSIRSVSAPSSDFHRS